MKTARADVKIRAGNGGMLYCIECGCCSGELGQGWVAMRCDLPDDDEDEPGAPSIALYCPVCAAEQFGYRPDVAARYVCAWDPLPAEATGEH